MVIIVQPGIRVHGISDLPSDLQVLDACVLHHLSEVFGGLLDTMVWLFCSNKAGIA